jgi:signal transduction histidine kinase
MIGDACGQVRRARRVDEVSKRPAAGGGASSGGRGFLRDRPIWVKLGLIMIVPTIATVVVGFSALLTNIRGAGDASTVQTVAALDQQIGSLTDALQSERAAANTVLGQLSSTEKDTASKHYQSLFTATDQAASIYHARRTEVGNLNSSFTATLQSVDTALAGLTDVRNQATQGAPKDTVVKRYDSIIDGLLSTRQAAALLVTDSDVNQAMQTANALSSYKEALAQERITVDNLLLAGSVSAAQLSDVYVTIARQEYALRIFTDLTKGTDDESYFTKTTEDGTSTQRASIEQQVLRAVGPGGSLQVNRGNWDDLVDSHMLKLRTAEQHFDDAVARDARTLHENEQQQVLVAASLLLALVLVAVAIAWMMARSMNRSLRELRHGALAIAQYGLPQAVARLRDPSLNTGLSPHQVAQQIADPLPVRSRDEFGQVTEAFNAVHLEAVRTAAEQAALRASVATMFVNLARRSQILVDRLIGHLDRLERGEEDPDRLAELFQLDHLATRMRRNDENLLVLAGADSTRVQRDPAALIDVLRAAQSEVEHYTRIEFGVIDRDIEIAAHAVNDLVHLVAELFDNATAFSPPDSTVVVEARRVGDRAVLYVEDHGIGISPEQMADLNERLATPPMVDVAVSRMMGLVVVARLAVRHEVKVELRPARERGTIADVLLPTSVLVPRALAGRGQPASLPSTPQSPQSPQSPPRGGSPLALESGAADRGRGQGIYGAFQRDHEPDASARPAFGAFDQGTPSRASSGGFDQSSANRAPSGGFDQDTANRAPSGGFDQVGAGRTAAGGVEPGAEGPTGSRNLPPWSDLTGAGANRGESTHNGADNHPPLRPAGESLPQRPSDSGAAEPGHPVPRQMSSSPEVTEAPGRPAGDAPREGYVVPDPPTRPVPPAAAPPAWPPAPPAGSAPAEDEPAAPAVPERVAAALDITSEIPRVRRPESASEDAVPAGYHAPQVPQEPAAAPAPAPEPAAAQPPATPEPATPEPAAAPAEAAPLRVTQHADETMELPIFRELESAWFRTSFEFEFGSAPRDPELDAEPEPQPAAQAEPAPQATQSEPARPVAEPAVVAGRPASPAGNGASAPARASRPERASQPRPEEVWRTAADQGWLAAQAAAKPQVEATTEAGLPRRQPMAQLVPGGIEKPNAGVQKRSPEQVRGLLSAYHRGVQRGRTDGGTPAAGNSPHSGKEQEA